MPAALCVQYLDQQLRNHHGKNHNLLLGLRHEGIVADENIFLHKIIGKSLIQTAIVNGIFFVAYLLVLIGTISILYTYNGAIIECSGVSWVFLWFFAALGGVLSLRVRHAYISFLFFLSAVVLISNI
ncbi:MAG: hypothetical protein MI749_16595 [Desulfovibrionales bacterium]|nr:hypothetical protein [Desulfovibrionales bacterium]